MYKNMIRLVSLFYLVCSFIKGQMDYKIIVPEFICGRNRGLTGEKDTTTIEFEGEGKIDFFKVNFETLSNPCRNTQRCNLIVWKVVRQFEKYLNNSLLTETTTIDFNNSMLIPGYRYILNAFVSQGQQKDQKQITLNFPDNNIIRSSSKPFASVKLIGVSSTETHITYIINANIRICSDIPNFYFRWELLDESHNLLKIFPDRSSELIIPPFTFHGGKQYNIKCYLLNLSNNEVVAENMHLLHVQKGKDTLVVKLPMVHTTVKIGQPINVRPFIKNLADEEPIKKIWSCIYNNKDFCANKSDDELHIERGFLNEGEYNISLTLTKGIETKTVFSLIKVLKDVPSIEIDTIDTPILPSSGLKIKANIEDLTTLCTLRWKSIEGPFFLNLNSIPGSVSEVHHVTAKKDLFLRELEEFSSDVVTKEFTLIIPPASDKWGGLPSRGEDYKLQIELDVNCPKVLPEEINAETELSEELFNNSVIVSALVEIDIVVPPKLESFEVIPNLGVALETVFIFQCGEAKKSRTANLFLYRFGYMLGDRKFIFSNQLGFRKAETILPYSDAVETFIEVCEGYNSCNVLFGPTIQTSLPSKINEEGFNIFKQNLNTEDYYKAFGYALTIMTLNNIAVPEEHSRISNEMSSQIIEKIQYLINTYNIEDKIWEKRVNKLINEIKEFSKELIFSEDILDGLSMLRDKLLSGRRGKLFLARRNLLTTTKRTLTFDSFKSLIDVSDLIITSSSSSEKIEAEKQFLETKIVEYFGILCGQLYETEQDISLEYQNVIVVLEKFAKKSYDNVQVIPFDGNSWNTTAKIKFDSNIIENLGKNKLCLGKIGFKDYSNKQGISYMINIFDGDSESMIAQPIPSTILLPISEHNMVNSRPKCVVYNNGWQPNCTFTGHISKFVQCHCPTVGAFYLEYENMLALATTPLNMFTGNKNLIETTTELAKTSETIGPDQPSPQSTGNYISTTVSLNNDNGNTVMTGTEKEKYTTSITNTIDLTTPDDNIYKNTPVEDSSQTTIIGINTNTPIVIEINNHLDDFTKVNQQHTDVFGDSTQATIEIDTNNPITIEINDHLDSFPEVLSTPSTDNVYPKPDIPLTTALVGNNDNIPAEENPKPNPTVVDSTSIFSLGHTMTDSTTKELTAENPVTKIADSGNEEATSSIIEINPTDIHSIQSTTLSVTNEEMTTNSVSDVEEQTQRAITPGHLQTELANKISTETTPYDIKFTTSVLVKTTTEESHTTVDNMRGGVFQGGITGNFFTNFSLNFLFNTTFWS